MSKSTALIISLSALVGVLATLVVLRFNDREAPRPPVAAKVETPVAKPGPSLFLAEFESYCLSTGAQPDLVAARAQERGLRLAPKEGAGEDDRRYEAPATAGSGVSVVMTGRNASASFGGDSVQRGYYCSVGADC